MKKKYKHLLATVTSSPYLIPLALVDSLFSLIKQEGGEIKDTKIHTLLDSFNIPKDHHESCMTTIMAWFNEEDNDEEEAKVPKVAKPKKDSVVVGEPYEKLFGEAGFTEVCILISDFDVEKATDIYLEMDFRLVLRAYSLKTDLVMAGVISQFQAAGAAFGGGLGGESAAGDEVIDARNLKGIITG